MNLLLIFDKERNRHAGSSTVSLRQNGVGADFVMADAILPKGHE